MSKKALFVRTLPIELVDLSLSGCRLRSNVELPAGSMGELQVTVSGTSYRDAVYLVRSTERPGSGHRRELGAEFVWGRYPAELAAYSARTIVPHS